MGVFNDQSLHRQSVASLRALSIRDHYVFGLFAPLPAVSPSRAHQLECSTPLLQRPRWEHAAKEGDHLASVMHDVLMMGLSASPRR